MSRYRLTPTPAQEAAMREHCAHARFVWNLAVEQHSFWQPGRKAAPRYVAQARHLAEARAEFGWLQHGIVQYEQRTESGSTSVTGAARSSRTVAPGGLPGAPGSTR
jgi:putative transposase